MRPSLADLTPRASGLVVVAAALGGCTFLPGAPWGEVEEASLEVTFAPAPLDDGRVAASAAYALALDEVRLTVEGLALFVGAPTGGGEHDHAHGHAHDDEGEPEGEHEPALHLPGGELTLAWGEEPTSLSLASCAGGCLLPRGELEEGELTLTALELRGTAYDRRTGPDARLPDEGVPLSARVEGHVRLSAPLSLALAGPTTTHVSLAAGLTLPRAPLADVDLAALPRDDDGALVLDAHARAAVIAALAESELSLSVESAHEHEGEHEHEHEHDHDHDHEDEG